jgi:hypothetical protein
VIDATLKDCIVVDGGDGKAQSRRRKRHCGRSTVPSRGGHSSGRKLYYLGRNKRGRIACLRHAEYRERMVNGTMKWVAVSVWR